MDMTEFNYNIAQGEFADETVTLRYDNCLYDVPAVVSRKYARKEVDGRYSTDLPLYTISVTIAESLIPSSIPSDNLRLVEIVLDGETYAVRYITGTGFLTFTLKPMDGSGDEESEIDDSTVAEENEEEEIG